MFKIVCVLDGSEFTGLVEDASIETEFSYDRVVTVYGHAGKLVFPKKVWKRVDELPSLEVMPSIEKYPGEETH